MKNREEGDKSYSKYMVIMKMTDQDSADEFYLQFNGKQFNSMEVSIYKN